MIDYNVKHKLEQLIEIALDEDVEDATSNAIFDENDKASANIICKENGILADIDCALYVFTMLDENVKIKKLKENSHRIKQGDIVAELKGSVLSILRGERICLNILQRACGIATKVYELSEKISHTKARILDTRKTAPGLRFLDKLAVKYGGGLNHRMGLNDMILIKDNHIDRAGSIKNAIENVKKSKYPDLPVEIECRTLEDVETCIKIGGVDRIMLDNMSPDLMKKCVDFVSGRIELEASGGIDENNIVKTAESGVDYISVGALTHSVKALDLSLYIEKKE